MKNSFAFLSIFFTTTLLFGIVSYSKAQTLLHSNGSFVTHPGGGAGGADASSMENTTLGYSNFGYTVNNSIPIRLTDNFTNTSPWFIDYIDVFAYQTGSTTSSTFTGGMLKIWNDDPSTGTALTEFGDFTTNVIALTNWTNCFRVQESAGLLATNRPIMRIRLTVNAMIPAGTHWVEWGLTGSLASGPFGPGISILGTGATGDAKQFNTTGYTATLTNGAYPIGMPFDVYGKNFVLSSISSSAICPGSSMIVGFTDIARNLGNIYTLELSDASGNFPGTLLTTTVNSPTQLSGVIPWSATAGTLYKVRINASDPTANSTESTSFEILTSPSTPSVTPTSPIAISSGQYLILTASSAGGTLNWYNSSNVLIGTGSAYTTPALITPTQYYVNEVTGSCTSPNANVNINIASPPITGVKRKFN